MSGNKSGSYCTSFCNYSHSMSSGKPIGHECYVIPPMAIAAEMAGDMRLACELIQQGKRYLVYGERSLLPHRGIRRKAAQTESE